MFHPFKLDFFDKKMSNYINRKEDIHDDVIPMLSLPRGKGKGLTIGDIYYDLEKGKLYIFNFIRKKGDRSKLKIVGYGFFVYDMKNHEIGEFDYLFGLFTINNFTLTPSFYIGNLYEKSIDSIMKVLKSSLDKYLQVSQINNIYQISPENIIKSNFLSNVLYFFKNYLEEMKYIEIDVFYPMGYMNITHEKGNLKEDIMQLYEHQDNFNIKVSLENLSESADFYLTHQKEKNSFGLYMKNPFTNTYDDLMKDVKEVNIPIKPGITDTDRYCVTGDLFEYRKIMNIETFTELLYPLISQHPYFRDFDAKTIYYTFSKLFIQLNEDTGKVSLSFANKTDMKKDKLAFIISLNIYVHQAAIEQKPEYQKAILEYIHTL